MNGFGVKLRVSLDLGGDFDFISGNTVDAEQIQAWPVYFRDQQFQSMRPI
jgi:hypothetical protein